MSFKFDQRARGGLSYSDAAKFKRFGRCDHVDDEEKPIDCELKDTNIGDISRALRHGLDLDMAETETEGASKMSLINESLTTFSPAAFLIRSGNLFEPVTEHLRT